MRGKSQRQHVIERLLSEETVGNQVQLVELLAHEGIAKVFHRLDTATFACFDIKIDGLRRDDRENGGSAEARSQRQSSRPARKQLEDSIQQTGLGKRIGRASHSQFRLEASAHCWTRIDGRRRFRATPPSNFTPRE